MPVRLRITILFTLLVFFILGLVCGAVYYISYTSRTNIVKIRLTNRAITTARLLSQSEIFDYALVQRIDAATTMALKEKTVQAYDFRDKVIYHYSESIDTLIIGPEKLDEARREQHIYFEQDNKEVIAYYFSENNNKILMVVAAFDEEGKNKLKQLRLILWVSFLGGVIIAFAGGYFFSKQLLRPVRKIADEVNEISAKDFNRRIEGGKARDEWNYLANTLNQLLDRLRDSFETQRRFISNASHELSTPLTSISSQLEVSLQRDRVAEDYRKVMQSVYQDVRQMNKLTQTLLEFAKASATSGGLEIDLVRVDEILLRMPSEMAKANSEYSVALIFEELPPEEEKLLVFGNEELLFLAIKNIVINACKYSNNKKATIQLIVSNNELIIGIQDSGIGIPPEELEYIFQPFYRANEDRSIPGFGLGLPLANRIIKLHKGYIYIESIVGKGTLFNISLPPAGSINQHF